MEYLLDVSIQQQLQYHHQHLYYIYFKIKIKKMEYLLDILIQQQQQYHHQHTINKSNPINNIALGLIGKSFHYLESDIIKKNLYNNTNY